MSFSKLPGEIVDLVCEKVYGLETGVGSETLRRLCLVSRQTLDSARRWLYRAPFRSSQLRRSRHRLFCLHRTLRDEPHLARLVQRLVHLGKAVRFLVDNPATHTSSASEQAVEPWSWQEDLVSLCPRLFHLAVLLHSAQQVKTLAIKVAQVEHVKYLDISFVGLEGPHSLFLHWTAAFDAQSKRPRLHYALKLDECVHVAPTQPQYWPRSLIIDLRPLFACPFSTLAFLPNILSHLTCLIILAPGRYREANVSALFSGLAGNSLTTFRLYDPFITEVLHSIEQYPPASTILSANILPPSAFSSFPKVVSLAYRGQRDMSLEKLSLLADTSPSLAKLDLSGSYWTFTASDFTRPSSSTTTAPTSAPAEERLIAILRRMEALKTIKLGVLPLNQHVERLSALQAYCESRGLKLEVEGCVGTA